MLFVPYAVPVVLTRFGVSFLNELQRNKALDVSEIWMTAGSFSELPQVQKVLVRCRRQILLHTLLVGLATVLIAVVGYLFTVSVLDYVIGLPGFVRATVLLLFVAGTCYAVWRYLIRPLRAATPTQQLSAAIDLTCPQMQESLTTLISIQSPEASVAESGSEVMQDKLQQQVTEQLRSLGPQQFVNAQQMQKRCGLAGLVLILALVPLLLWPSASALSMKRFVQPFANLATVSNLHFNVSNGNRTVARWSNVVLQATPAWRNGKSLERPEHVQLKLMADNGQTEFVPMAFDEVNGCFTYQLSRISDSIQFQIHGGGAASETFRVHVVDAPSVELSVLTATPPPYTGRAVRRFEGMTETMKVFERSDLSIHLEFNKPVQAASLVWVRRDERPLTQEELFDLEFDKLTGEEVPMMDLGVPIRPEPEPLIMRSEARLSDDRMSAFLNLTADVGGDFEFSVVDEFSLGNQSEQYRSLKVIFDEPPTIMVSGIHNEDQFRTNDILPVNCLVSDDIGVGTVEMRYSINSSPTVAVAAVGFDSGDKEVRQKFRLPLEELNVKDGDWLTIKVRATDECPNPEPHEVWSDEFAIEISKDARPPGAQALEEEAQEMIEALKQLERQLDRDETTAETLKLAARREWNQADREKVRRLSEKEQQQGRILEQLTAEVETHPLMKSEAEALKQLIPEVREELPQLLDTTADQNRIAAPKSLQAAADQLQDVRRKLQLQIEAIEKKAKLEQNLTELNRLALDAEKLSQDANKLETDRQHQENKPEKISEQEWEQQLEDRREQLSEKRKTLTEDIEGLLDEERELLQAAQRAQTEQFDKLKQVASELAEQQNRVAAGVKKEAAEALDNLNQDDSAASADQQQAQRDIAKQTRELPEDLSELAERMALEALEMRQQAHQASTAQEMAQQAQQSAEQAATQLEHGELGQAGESGQLAADQLNQVADGQPGEQPGEQQPTDGQPAEEASELVPSEVGESVADALQKLQQAAKTMQQESDQHGQMESGESAEQGNNAEQGQPGEGEQSDSQDGQPGDGKPTDQQSSGKPSSSQQKLDSAAQSLAQAAKDALPGQFDPGQPPDGNESQQAGRDAMGNPAMWDGRIPDDVLNEIAGSRDWGKASDDLDSGLSNSARTSRDNEYQSLIRRYFRELAKATEAAP